MAAAKEMTAGVHLPQAGPAASGDAMARAAELAEELGFADVWVSDHLVVPTGAEYPPSAYVYEPLASLAWVAARTQRVGLGTTVLVLPMRNPLAVAKTIASIDQMSGGRFILGTAAGWLEAEFDALGVPFGERGPRTDEAIDIIRSMWTDDHITADYPVHGAHFESMRAKPQPARSVPLWIRRPCGGGAPARGARWRRLARCLSEPRADRATRVPAASRSPRGRLRDLHEDQVGRARG